MRSMKVLGWGAVALSYALIVLGGWVRTTNSGLSCPDWPTCYGQWWLTPTDFAALGDVGYYYYQVMLEWVHRLIAGMILGPLILVLAVLAFRRRGDDRRGWHLALGILVVLFIQAKLGGITVLDRNSPWSVALHLGNALLLVGLLVLFALRHGSRSDADVGAPVRAIAIVTTLLAVGAMVTAAMTAKSGASLACSTWPDCDGTFLPALDDPLVRIHFFHRTLAACTGLGVILLAIFGRHSPALRPLVFAALLVVAAQVTLGAIVIESEVLLWSAVMHQAIGVLLFVILVTTMWKAWLAGDPVSHLNGGAHVGLRGA